jgi:replicative DNA helicase
MELAGVEKGTEDSVKAKEKLRVQNHSSLVEWPATLAAVQAELDEDIRGDLPRALQPMPTGFAPLDDFMGGGTHIEELILLAGIQGVGKTTAMMQLAKQVALSGRLSIVACYEHSRRQLFFRTLCMESYWNSGPKLTWEELRNTIIDLEDDSERCFDEMLRRLPAAREAWSRMARYMEGIQLVQADGVYFNTRELRKLVNNAVAKGYEYPFLFVDYVQIVPVDINELGWVPEGNDRIGVVMASLKKTVTDFHCTVCGIAAADEAGIRQQRIHLENLLGPSRVQYDPDTVWILNRGTADPSGPGITTVRWAIEKQRNGPQMIEFEFELDGKYYAFNPVGRLVGEDESFQSERIALREELRQQRRGLGAGHLVMPVQTTVVKEGRL